MRDFLEDRIRLVHDLLDSEIQVAYADLVLILCSVLSACAAQRWPGHRIDRVRFIEMLVKDSPSDAHVDWICVPALIINGHIAETDTPWGRGGASTRIFRDDEIDLELTGCQAAYPQVAVGALKDCSYASLIYQWLRCGYAHEYCPHANIVTVPASRHQARISYIGRLTPTNGITRMISFHLDYLIDLTLHHVSNISAPQSLRPNIWWINEV